MRRPPPGPTPALLAWVLLGHVPLVALRWLFYDRYLLPLFVPTIALALVRGQRPVAGSDTVRTVGYRRWLAPSGRIFVLERRPTAR